MMDAEASLDEISKQLVAVKDALQRIAGSLESLDYEGIAVYVKETPEEE
jgi:DNA-binding FrmR family transcriptional regulator